MQVLDRLVDFRSLVASKSQEGHRLESALCRVFQNDLQRKMDAIRELSPKWGGKREAILGTPEIKTAFLEMTEKSFLAIGPLAQDVRSSTKLLDGCDVVPRDFCKAAFAVADEATETVAFKYVVEHLERECPKLESPGDCPAAVAKLRKNLETSSCSFVSW